MEHYGVTTDCPIVSVGIPTYNGNNSVIEAALSVLQQGYPRLEVIISDDCSTDNTEELCLALSEKYPFVRYFRQPENIGLAQNFEFVMRQASGDFFMWVAHDDSLEPGIIKKYVDFLKNNPGYTLVSGRIRYLAGDACIYCEKDFNIQQERPGIRVVSYYFKVLHGAMFYGLMRKDTAVRIPLRTRIGDDWHFVASLTYLGKIRNLDCVGYNKRLGGTSKTFRHYATAIGASRFAASFPHLNIAFDAFSDILLRSPIYARMPRPSRLMLASTSFITILTSYYCKVYPFIVGGRLKRFLKRVYRYGASAMQKIRVAAFQRS